jgi:hypothetical protein
VTITDCGTPCIGGTGSVAGGSIKAVFANTHASGAIVFTSGVIPQGILNSSSSTLLNLVGDFNADGNIEFVQYNCDYTNNKLWRSITPITAGAASTSLVLLDNLYANPVSAGVSPPCFQYATTTSVTTSAGNTYNFRPSVGVTLTIQTTQLDPNTQTAAQETKSFLNVSPRNIVMGVRLANANQDRFLQSVPPNCTTLGFC